MDRRFVSSISSGSKYSKIVSKHQTPSHSPCCNMKNIENVLVGILFGCLCFYAGLLAGTTGSTLSEGSQDFKDSKLEALIQQRVHEGIRKLMATRNNDTASTDNINNNDYINYINYNNNSGGSSKSRSGCRTSDDTAQRFPSSITDIAVGMSVVSRKDFANRFSAMGIPLDESTEHNNQVLLLYQTESALPDYDMYINEEARRQTAVPFIPSVEDAVMNCDQLHVILSDHSSRKQCTAIMGQYEAFHIQKFMRLPSAEENSTIRESITGEHVMIKKNKRLDSSEPLRLVNRGAQTSGRHSTKPPTPHETSHYWTVLTTYLQTLDRVLDELRPVAAGVAVENTIIVLVCNFGQSELLLNFICSAQKRKLDLQPVLVFATDVETRDLVASMDIAVYYDLTNYGDMPKKAAARYADSTFTKMMMAKVFCVHMVAMLGYNVLFQDVDVVWYKNPLEYFRSSLLVESDKDFDVYFQDDGNHALFYAPYSANTGFYFVRNNLRTRHFLNNFLVQGDLIYSTRSHQVPLVALLQEHASLYGLRVKIFSRNEDDFPGGHAFHRRKSFMKNLFAGVVQPFIFHMSWTSNKANKIKFFQQMGEWFFLPQCIQKDVRSLSLLQEDSSRIDVMDQSNINNPKHHRKELSSIKVKCCSSEIIFKCHYKDKPSIKPCQNSPTIDHGHPSWW